MDVLFKLCVGLRMSSRIQEYVLKKTSLISHSTGQVKPYQSLKKHGVGYTNDE